MTTAANFQVENRLDEIERALQRERRIAATRGGGATIAHDRITLLLNEREQLLRQRGSPVS